MEITTHEYFAAAECKKQRACLGQLIQYIFSFGSSHLAHIVVLQIAVNTTLVAAISDVEMASPREAQSQGSPIYFLWVGRRPAGCHAV